jgi:DNA-binding NarL/FixJ family response regulator
LTVDDHPAVRAGLLAILDSEPGIVSLGAVDGAEQAVERAGRGRPDLILADYQLSDGDGLALCRSMEALPEPPRVLLYSAYAGDDLAIAALVAGANGVVSKAAPSDELFEAIRLAARGEDVLPPPSREVIAETARALEAEDMAILGMRVARTPVAQIADTLRTDREHVERRIDVILARLKGRVEGAPEVSPEPPRTELPEETARGRDARRGFAGLAARMVARGPAED